MNNRPHARLVLFVGIALAGFLGIALRAMWIQGFASEWFLQQGDWRHVASRELMGPRGDIIDRSGNVLASTVRMSTIAFDPQHFFLNHRDRADEFVRVASQLPGFDADRFETWQNMRPETDLPRYRVLARDMWTPDAEAVLAELAELGITSAYEVPDYRRVYPSPMSAGALLGFLGVPDGDTIARGVAGIEQTFDQQLQGSAMPYAVVRDRRGVAYSFTEEPVIAEARGATVRMTIDLALQQRVEEAMQQTVEHFEAESAVVVVSDVDTGALLALSAWPPLDPNLGAADPNAVYTHPAIGYVFEPGSTAKMLTFGAALEENLVSLDETIDCAGGQLYIGGGMVTDTHPLAMATALEVMTHSSNIGSLRIGMRLSAERFRQYLEEFGINQLSGIELPGEVDGSLPPLRAWGEAVHSRAAYGYGFNLTPLQLNMATNAVANGGELLRPHVVADVTLADGSVVYRGERSVSRRVISERAAAELNTALITVTTEAGTGTNAGVPGFLVAGKTGTAQLVGANGYAREYLASFTGYLPADAPRFAITVMVVRPNPRIGYYGGVVAAPLFRAAAIAALEREGIFASDRVGTELASPIEAIDATVAENIDQIDVQATASALGEVPADGLFAAALGGVRVQVPDLRGQWITQAIAGAEAAGFEVRIDGLAGRVVGQEPVGFARPGSVIVLQLEQGAADADGTAQ